jgi:hypothetical protein
VRLALILVAAMLLVPATAEAAPSLAIDLEQQTVAYGSRHVVSGTLADGVTPLPGQEVILEGRRYPYEGSYRVMAKALTDAGGNYIFKPKLDRDHILRVLAPAQLISSQSLRAYLVPAFSLSYRALGPGVARLTQSYTVPRPVRLSAPTHFYVGREGAKYASQTRAGRTKRVAAGRYTSSVTVHLPPAWHGRFHFGSCFRTSPGSGMGDPHATCPKLRLRF